MPKVTINDSQGLVQSTGSGVEVSSTMSMTGDVALSGVLSGIKQSVITVGRVLTAADSGAILIPGGSAQTFTLPAPAAGLCFKMYAGTAVAHKLQVSGGAKIYGVAINVNNEIAASAEGQKVDNKSAVAFGTAFQTGDFMEVVSDGTNWFLHAVTNDPLTLTA